MGTVKGQASQNKEEEKMGDNVSFKVFLKNDNEQEVRRFVIDKNVSTSYEYLLEKLRVVFPQIQGSVFTVGWTDEDGDHVTITSDEELIIALTEMAGPLYKLTVAVRKAAVQETAGAAGGDDAEIVHHGVTCDGCNMHPITGPRYKCLVRDDYDLCGRCEAAGLHLGNNMMKITTPGNVFPHRLFKRIQRLQEKAEKKTGKEPGWNEKLEKDMKQVEEQLRNGFSGPTQHCYGFGPRGRGFLRGGRGGMNRGPWSGAAGTPWNSAAPTWNAMMRGWMGEQPACRSQDKKDDEKTHEEAVKAAQEASKEAQEQAHSAAQAAAASAAFSFPTMTGPEDYLQNVGSFVAAALDPLGIDV